MTKTKKSTTAISWDDLTSKPSLATSATTDTTNASNISSGTLNSARLPANVTFTASVSAPALSGVHFGDGSKLTGLPATYTPPANATFTASVSAPALSGTFFGDGSRLTGVISTDSTKLPLAGGTLTGALSGVTATFRDSLSSNTAYFAGNVGIGINNPQVALDVNGVIEAISFRDTAVWATIGSLYTVNISSGSTFILTLQSGTAATISLPTPSVGQTFTVFIKQPGVGSPTTATFSASPSVKWPGGLPPTITPALNKIDVILFVTDGSGWYGSFIQNF